MSNLSIMQISNYLSGWYLCRHISSISTGHWTERQFSAYFSSVSRGRGGRIGKQNMRSKSSCSPGDAPPSTSLSTTSVLLNQGLYLGDRLGDGSASRIKDQRNPPGVAFASGSTSETPKHQKIWQNMNLKSSPGPGLRIEKHLKDWDVPVRLIWPLNTRYMICKRSWSAV